MNQQVDAGGWISDESEFYGEGETFLNADTKTRDLGSQYKATSFSSSVPSSAASKSDIKELINRKKNRLWAATDKPLVTSNLSSHVSSQARRKLKKTEEVHSPVIETTSNSSCESDGCEIPRFEGTEAAWQRSETIDQFLTRLPVSEPATASVGPWLWVENRRVPQGQQRTRNADIDALIQEGTQRLKNFISQTSQQGDKSRNGAEMQDRLRNDLISLVVKHGVTNGKWMLFPSMQHLTTVWQKIAHATAAGRLGPCSKVGTFESGRQCQLICVYTYDCRDTDDIHRVLKTIRSLEIIQRPVYYKCDAYTYLGIDSKHPGNFRPSLYSSRDFSAEDHASDARSAATR